MGKGRDKRKKNKRRQAEQKKFKKALSKKPVMEQANQIGKRRVMNAIVRFDANFATQSAEEFRSKVKA